VFNRTVIEILVSRKEKYSDSSHFLDKLPVVMPRPSSHTPLAGSSAAPTMITLTALLVTFMSIAAPTTPAQERTEIKTDGAAKASEKAASKQPTGASAGAKTTETEEYAEKNGDEPKDDSKTWGQFRKAVSPSGLQLGLTGPEATREFPEELREFAEDGALASAAKQWQKAKTAYQSMVKAAPDHPLALANLGTVEFRLEEYEAARDHLRESLSIAPTVAHHWLVLALCYYELEDLDLAMSCLFRARHEDKTDPRVHLYLAVMARDYGWQSAAEIELQRAIILDPQYTDAHYNLAMLYLEREPPSYELARRHYYFALDLGGEPDRKIEKILRDATLNR